MKRVEMFWLAFEKFAIAFSFVVNMVLVIIVLITALVMLLWGPTLKGMLLPLLPEVMEGVNAMGDATIRTNVAIDDKLPVNFALPVSFEVPIEKEITVELSRPVRINQWADITFPGGGGVLHARVTLDLPTGLRLPLRLYQRAETGNLEVMTVPVDHMVPVSTTVAVKMNVPVSIPLRDTELGPVVKHFKSLLQPYVDIVEKIP
ncbi:MAG: hypothetical protein ACUVV0_06385 [Anaerolineae bacterium]